MRRLVRTKKKGLSERKKKLENSAQRLKEMMFEGMKMTGANKIRRPEFDIMIKKNPPSLRIDKEENIPNEYFKNLAPVLGKTLLKDAIKSGLNLEGVQLVQTERLEIK